MQELFEKEEISFFPTNRALCLDEGEDNGVGLLADAARDLKRGVFGVVTKSTG